jgi:phenylpropionate dioxygenase-like ring-hydroxylating dioxygenase large terminal subunit
VSCDTWGGFVWINLDPAAEPLHEFLGVIPEHLDPYGFARWKLETDMTIEVECNWKTSVDAFNEAYHVHATHPATLEFTDDTGTVYDCYERHTRMIFPEIVASRRHPGHGTVTQGIKDNFLARVGVDVSRFEGGVDDARRAFAEAVRAMAGALGSDFSRLNESQMCDDFHYTVFPNLTFNIHSMFVWIFRHRPHPIDPNKMYFDFFNLLNTPSQDVPRPQHEFHRVADGFRMTNVPGGEILDEDMYNLPRIQAGMRSRAFEGLQLGSQEVRIRHFHQTLMRYLTTNPG